jgi:hypothetical protein
MWVGAPCRGHEPTRVPQTVVAMSPVAAPPKHHGLALLRGQRGLRVRIRLGVGGLRVSEGQAFPVSAYWGAAEEGGGIGIEPGGTCRRGASVEEGHIGIT